MKFRPSVLFLLFLLAPAGAAEQSGVVVREARVHAGADAASREIARLEAGTLVEVFSREGGWKEIYADKPAVTGWVRSYQVREGDYRPAADGGGDSDSRGFLSGLASLSRKASSFFKGDRGSTSSGTATIGVRGLSEDEIRSARPNFEELEKMEGFASGNKRARRFARDGGLEAIKVPYVSGPK